MQDFQNTVRTLPETPAPRVLANAIRVLTMDAVERAASGHPGMPMGMADAAVALFGTALVFDSGAPDWPNRDRLVLSAGHGSMLLYSALHLTGFPGFGIDSLKTFRSLGSPAAGHPEVNVAHGIEMTTGPLGQGLAASVGMALAERMLNARFGDDLVDHRTYVICSDGDLMEGVSHESASLAGHLRLSRLIVLYDDNGITIDGATDLSFSEDTTGRFEAYGWCVDSVDGHDPHAVAEALARARDADRPTLIRCRTVIAWGSPGKAGDAASHFGAFGPDEIAAARTRLDWPHPPFVVPEDVAGAWRSFGHAGQRARAAWLSRLAETPPAKRRAFETALAGDLPDSLVDVVGALKRSAMGHDKPQATRAASGAALEQMVAEMPHMVGGSGDLTSANNTRTKDQDRVSPSNYGGRYIHYGAREHGMAGLMNGLALHGGFIPYGGSFLVFTDYAKPALRLSALMRCRTIHVMTHDSVAVGEDGPTHQPVEHLAGLRAIPGLRVFRPADAIEVAECWELALRHSEGPSVMSLSRQAVPRVRQEPDEENLSARGAYVLADAEGERVVTIYATGSEVAVAIEARERLEREGIGVRVVSMPCHELFEEQDESYQEEVLADSVVNVAIEAAARLGWDRYIGRRGVFIGMNGFGASAPTEVLLEHFGINADAVVAEVTTRLDQAGGRAWQTKTADRAFRRSQRSPAK